MLRQGADGFRKTSPAPSPVLLHKVHMLARVKSFLSLKKKTTLKNLPPSPSSFTHVLTPNWQSQWKRILHFGSRAGSALAAGLIPNPLELKELVPTSTGFGLGLTRRNLLPFVLRGGLSATFALWWAPTCNVVTDTWIYITVSELGCPYNLASFKSHFSHYDEIWTPLMGGTVVTSHTCFPPCPIHS